MKILITMKLSNKILKYHLLPLITNNNIEKIIVVRDTKGPQLDKVTYYCPPFKNKNFIHLNLLIKFFLMIFLSVKERPALIHGFYSSPHGLLALLAGKLTHRKTSVSLTSGPKEMYVLGENIINTFSYTRPLPKLSLKGRLICLFFKKFDYIFVAGNYTKKFLLNNGFKNNIIIMPYCIDDMTCKPLSLKKIYDLIFVGRLSKEKHIESLIEITNVLKSTYNLSNIRVLILGDGLEYSFLLSLRNKYSLQENIIFKKYDDNVSYYFNLSKLLIITSERETGPYTLIESTQCGTPVISTRCGDMVNDLIIDDYNGYLIDDYNKINLFADKINYLLNNPIKLADFSKNVLYISKKISIKNISDIWDNILTSN